MPWIAEAMPSCNLFRYASMNETPPVLLVESDPALTVTKFHVLRMML
jgi:hypothetical protein